MKADKTHRGFDIIKFNDSKDIPCSLQKSSIATEDCIWLGCNSADPQVLISGKGWQPVKMPDEYVANTRMHLTQDQVRELLPHLQKFIDTGDI